MTHCKAACGGLPSPPPEKSAAWSTRLLHGRAPWLIGPLLAGLYANAYSPSEPLPYVPTVRTATVMSASEVSAPPYGKPCLQTGQG